MCHVVVTVGAGDTRQTKKESSVSMDTATPVEDTSGDVVEQDLTPER